MIFSKTFNSDLYSQIVCMMDEERVFGEKWMHFDKVVSFYFYLDGSVHKFNVSFGNTDLGIKLRQEFFDGLNAEGVQQFIFDKLEEGKQ